MLLSVSDVVKYRIMILPDKQERKKDKEESCEKSPGERNLSEKLLHLIKSIEKLNTKGMASEHNHLFA